MEADLARYKCAMAMVDGALERSDVDGCERGIALGSPLLSVRESWFKVGEYTRYFLFFVFKKKHCLSSSSDFVIVDTSRDEL